MTRIWLSLCAVAAVSACGPTSPPAQGVGFGSYEAYAYSSQRARQAQLETPLELSPENTGAPAPAPTGRGGVTPEELAAAGIDTSSTLRVRTGAGQVLHEPPVTASGTPARAVGRPRTVDPVPPEGAEVATAANSVALASVEPVSASQGAPMSALRPGAISDQRYATAATPQATPEAASVANRPARVGPDVVAFALATSHEVGTKVYSRSFASQAKARRACARYTGTDQAQRAFLEAGGPQRDRLGLDPDGDGYACGWSPEAFRAARSG